MRRLTLRSTSTYGLIDGGRAGMVYVYLASFVGFFASVISMAEIASMYVLFRVFSSMLKHIGQKLICSAPPHLLASTTGSASLLRLDGSAS